MVKALTKRGEDILSETTPQKANLTHLALGVGGEAGELIDAIKRYTQYDKELNTDNVIEELGDLEFFMAAMRDALGITRDQCLEANEEKLKKRYPGYRYTNQAAHDRADKK